VREPGAALLNVPSVERMQTLGEAIGRAIAREPGSFIVALEGELGAGKTTLVGAILRAQGIAGPVRSPTYTLIEPYLSSGVPGSPGASGRHLYHMDLYRLTDPHEMEPLGVRDLLSEAAVLLIEWPSRAAGALPSFDLSIDIDYPAAGSAGRRVTLQPRSSAGHNVMRHIVAAIPEMGLLSP
jgi:tRNA threonylcarbamoyladenosine biosynthesis protein TsaE